VKQPLIPNSIVVECHVFMSICVFACAQRNCKATRVSAYLLSLIRGFISSRLDYCKSLLYGVSDNLIRRVQSVQNAAARLLTGAGWRDYI